MLPREGDWNMVFKSVVDLLVIGALVLFIIATAIWTQVSDLFTSVATLLSTFLGAKLAFNYQTNKEAAEEKQSRITAGNLTMFKIGTMLSQLLSYRIQIIDPHRNDPMRFLSMPPTVDRLGSISSIDFDSMSFLFESEERNLLGELSAAQSHYFSIGESIKDRSQYHRYEVQPLLNEAGFVEGEMYSLEHIKEILGDRTFATIHKSTNEVIEHVDFCIASLDSIGSRLKKELKQVFPDDLIISIRDSTKIESDVETSGSV